MPSTTPIRFDDSPRSFCASCGEPISAGEDTCLDCDPIPCPACYDEPDDDEPDADFGPPLCRTKGCAELGRRAADRFGRCEECNEAQEEDASDAHHDAEFEAARDREPDRDGIDAGIRLRHAVQGRP